MKFTIIMFLTLTVFLELFELGYSIISPLRQRPAPAVPAVPAGPGSTVRITGQNVGLPDIGLLSKVPPDGDFYKIVEPFGLLESPDGEFIIAIVDYPSNTVRGIFTDDRIRIKLNKHYTLDMRTMGPEDLARYPVGHAFRPSTIIRRSARLNARRNLH